jgi:hypothetical protein
MKKRPIFLYILFVPAVMALIFTVYARSWLNHEQTKLTEKRTKEILNSELPIGTDKSQVKRFLDRNAWDYSEGGSTIQAIVGDASRNVLIRTNIRVQFYFDSQGKLVSYDLQDLHTGP